MLRQGTASKVGKHWHPRRHLERWTRKVRVVRPRSGGRCSRDRGLGRIRDGLDPEALADTGDYQNTEYLSFAKQTTASLYPASISVSGLAGSATTRRVCRVSLSQPLNAEPQSYGQFGEDRILGEIFGDRAEGYCVEIGAHDGLTGSASYVFEKRGWHCLLVEPVPALVEEIRRHRACAVVNCAVSDREGVATFGVAEGVEAMSTLDLTPGHREWIKREGGAVKEITVRTATLDSVLAEAAFPEIQFITIDVEGHEMAVLEGFTLKAHRPRIVIIEDNSISGDPRVANYMADRGYVHFRRTGVNEWYAHESDVELVQPDEIRRFERAKAQQRWGRRRQHVANRVATRVGRYLPAPMKQRLSGVYNLLAGK